MKEDLVSVHVDESVAVVTLDDPDRRNAISLAMAEQIGAALDAVEAADDVRAVVVTGRGRTFCAGADLDVLAGGDPEQYGRLYEAFLRFARTDIPTFAAVNGAAAGAGMNLALCCDIRVTCPESRFLARFLDLGLHPGGGHTWMLQRAVGAECAKAIVLCGEELDGVQAVRAGLAYTCVPAAELMAETMRLARRAAAVPRDLLVRTKLTMDTVSGTASRWQAVEAESEAQAWSASLPHFQEKVAGLKLRISGREAPR